MRRFYSNVRFLSVLRFGGVVGGCRALLARTGWKTNDITGRKYVSGVYSDTRFTVLQAWALLFGYSVADLLGRDLRAEGEIEKG